MKNELFYYHKHLLILIFIFFLSSKTNSQIPYPHSDCVGVCTSCTSNNQSVANGVNCGQTSQYYSNRSYYSPNSNTPVKYVRVNLIFVHRDDGTGNFNLGDVEHDQILQDVEGNTNNIWANLNIGACGGSISDSKIQFLFKRIDINNSYYWDCGNDFNTYACPSRTNWYMLPLIPYIHSMASYEPGIDMFFTEENCHYNQIVLGQNTCTNTLPYNPCSMYSSPIISDNSFIHMKGYFTKMWDMKYNAPTIYSQPWNPVIRGWFVSTLTEDFCHEIGHSFSLGHVTTCHNIMNPAFGPIHDYLTDSQLQEIHRTLALTNMRRFVVDCAYSSTDNWTISGNAQWDFNIKLYNDVIIPSGSTLTVTCRMEMPAGGKILVQNGGQLIVDGGTISNGCNELWDGIYVESGGNVITKNGATIEQAQYAINLSSGATFNSTATTFNNNYIGIFISQSSIGANNINGYISGCTFRSNDNLVASFSGQPSSSSTNGYAGIYLNDVGYFAIGNASDPNPNVFDGLENGIYLNRTSSNIRNCKFLHIRDHQQYQGQKNGTAVYSTGGHGVYTTNLMGFGKFNSTYTFEDCTNGVYSEYHINTYVYSCNMNNIDNAVKIHNSLYTTSRVYTNHITCNKTGIDLFYNNKAKLISIFSNTIEVAPVSINPSTVANSAAVFGADPLNSVAALPYLYISANNITNENGEAGIHLRDVNKARISLNTINLTQNNSNSSLSRIFGINLEASDEGIVAKNVVNGIDNSSTSSQEGFYLSLSDYCSLSCNYTNNTLYGNHFAGTCLSSSFIGANMQDHFEGLHLDRFSIMGVQDQNGNTWNGNYGSGYGAVNNNGSQPAYITASRFNVNPAFGTAYNPAFTPANWFLSSSIGTTKTCSSIPNSNLFDLSPVELNALDLAISNGDVGADEYNSQMKFLSERYLLDKLIDNPSFISEDPSFQIFYSRMMSSIAKNLKDVASDINQAEEPNPIIGLQLSNHIDQLNQFIVDVGQIESQLNEETDDNVKASLIGSIDNLKLQIIALQNLIESESNTINQDRALLLSNIHTENSQLTINQVIEENEKRINEIYINTVAIGNFDFSEEQLQTLNEIAQQCPFAGGKAVYFARSLYKLHDNAVAYNDPENCTPLGFYKIRNSTEAKNNAIKIFPNPVSNLASVVYAFEEESKGELMIYDLVGTKILTIELNANSKKVEFSTSNLVNGVYGYVIMKNELPISQGKFVVIK